MSELWTLSDQHKSTTVNVAPKWTVQGLVDWVFGAKRNSAIFVGYQYRDMKYTKADVIEVEKTLSGPGLGVKIGF